VVGTLPGCGGLGVAARAGLGADEGRPRLAGTGQRKERDTEREAMDGEEAARHRCDRRGSAAAERRPLQPLVSWRSGVASIFTAAGR